MVARDIDAEWAASELISKTVLDAAEAAGLGVIIARIGVERTRLLYANGAGG